MKYYSIRWGRKEVLVLTLNLEGAIPWAVSPQPTPLIAPRQLPKRLLTSLFIGLGMQPRLTPHLGPGRLPLYFFPCQAPVLGTSRPFSAGLGVSSSSVISGEEQSELIRGSPFDRGQVEHTPQLTD